MNSTPQEKNLEKQRAELTRMIDAVVTAQAELTVETRPAEARQELCYDARHPKSYYEKFEQRCKKLRQQSELSLAEREIILNQALGYASYHDIHREHIEKRLIESYQAHRAARAGTPPTSPPPKLVVQSRRRGRENSSNHAETAPPMRPQRRLNHGMPQPRHRFDREPGMLIDLALYHIKIKPSLDQAMKYLLEARTVMQADPEQFHNEAHAGARLYNHLSVVAEEQDQPAQAREYLTSAIGCAERYDKSQRLIKGLHIKRALLHRRLGDPTAALQDLDRALAHRCDYYEEVNMFAQDELIHWEKTKIFVQQKNYPQAAACLQQLRHVCQLNYHDDEKLAGRPARTELLRQVDAYEAAIPPMKRLAGERWLTEYRRAEVLPERPANYDSFQVNVKCPVYLKFIAKLQAQNTQNPARLGISGRL